MTSTAGHRPRRPLTSLSHLLPGGASLAALLAPLSGAQAVEIQTNIPELSLRWDNTITENVLVRTEGASTVNLNSPNNDDPDRNLPHGLAAARTDLVSELDVAYREFGARASVAAWADAVYLYNNQNNSPPTLNSNVSNNKEWQSDTQKLAGYRAEVGDLFTYGSFTPAGEQKISYKIGQFAQLWGETLYLAGNGIAAGMNPIDGIKAQILLNAQARDVYMPTQQIAVTYQPTAPLTFSAYYKGAFRQTRAAPSGTYFSSTDILDTGGDFLYTTLPGGTLAHLVRGSDIRPNGFDGQFGVSMRYNLGDYNIGLYALRYDEMTPQQVYPHPFSASAIAAGTTAYIKAHAASGRSIAQLVNDYFATNPIGTYQIVYPKGIQMYGASISGNAFEVINYGAELSVRHGTDLASAIPDAPLYASNGNNVFYPVGDTLHGNTSFIYASPPVPAIRADQVQITGEIGFNQLLRVTDNKQNQAPGVSHFASLGDVVLSASYYSILPGLDLTPSIGIYGQIVNNSSVDTSERAHTGNISLGLLGVLNQRFNFQIQYRHYAGKNSSTNPNENNLLLGRDFVGFSFSTVL